MSKITRIDWNRFLHEFSERIIFAITVHTIECWLLPLYYDDANKSKFKGCLDRLNLALNRREGFTISAKTPEYYDSISRKYLKQKTLMSKYGDNPSFKIFIEELVKKSF